MKQIKYKTSYLKVSASKTEGIRWWTLYGLKSGGIESQIKKLQELMSVLVESHLSESPRDLKKISQIVAIDGEHGHEIVEEEM